MFASFTAVIRATGLVLAGLLVGQNAVAQTAPAWVSTKANQWYFSPAPRRVVDADGNLYEVGTFSVATNVASTVLTTQGGYDGYLAKYTPTGTLAWVHQFASVGEDQATDVALDAAGNAYVVGLFSHAISLGNGQTLSAGTYVGRKAFVIKYDPAGNPLWAQQNTSYPGTSLPLCPPEASSFGVQVDAADHVIITGSYALATAFGFGSLQVASPISANNSLLMPVFMARFSATTGAPQLLIPIMYSDRSTGAGVMYPQKILNSPTGGYYLVTQYYMTPSFTTGVALPPTSSTDILVVKYTSTGQFEWARTFGGPDYDDVTQAATDAAGNIYLTGSFRQSLRFGATTLTSGGADDGYLVKYSPQGAEQWVQSLSSAAADILYGLCVDSPGNVYVTGGFGNQAHLGSATLTSAGMRDIVVAAYSPQGQLSWVQQAGGPDDDQGIKLGFTAQGRLRVFGYSGYNASFGTATVYTPSYSGFVAELGLNTSPLAATAAQALPLGLYPNPASTQVHLPGLATGTKVQIIDILGHIVRSTAIALDATVPVQGLTPGIYTLRATDPQGHLLVGRVVVAN
jgi:hypothetical protein